MGNDSIKVTGLQAARLDEGESVIITVTTGADEGDLIWAFTGFGYNEYCIIVKKEGNKVSLKKEVLCH